MITDTLAVVYDLSASALRGTPLWREAVKVYGSILRDVLAVKGLKVKIFGLASEIGEITSDEYGLLWPYACFGEGTNYSAVAYLAKEYAHVVFITDEQPYWNSGQQHAGLKLLDNVTVVVHKITPEEWEWSFK